MQYVPINAIPNQSLSVQIDNNLFDIALRAANGIMAASISINTVPVVKNIRCVPYQQIIPARYLENGNFVFITLNQELPWYEQFNITQSLVYATEAELIAARAPVEPPINFSYFNPLGALPLRFKPQGY